MPPQRARELRVEAARAALDRACLRLAGRDPAASQARWVREQAVLSAAQELGEALAELRAHAPTT